MRSDAIFNFASDYFYRNPSIAAPENYVFRDEQYQDFVDYLLEGKSNFQTKSEMKFQAAYELSEKESLSDGIRNSYNDLKRQLELQKIEELGQNKDRIKAILSDEIINRYYFKKGEYQNHIVFSPYIKRAIEILESDDQYRSILMNGKN
jgi:carboxyl-terminal processing protease